MITESRFNAWRACVAIIHLDKVVAPTEREWLQNKIAKLPFTESQVSTLRQDLKNGLKLEAVIEKISDNVDKIFLLDTFKFLAFIDKNFSPEEITALKETESYLIKKMKVDRI